MRGPAPCRRGPCSRVLQALIAPERRRGIGVVAGDLRHAADRIQGKDQHKTRNTLLLLIGIALGALFNPVTGPSTRKLVKDTVFGSDDDFSYSTSGGNSYGTSSYSTSGSTVGGPPTTDVTGTSESSTFGDTETTTES